jgi:IclR family pca regulon transcriptional regulator
MGSEKKHRYFIQSLAKGLAGLQAFTDIGRPLILSELAQAVGITNTAALRLCYTLTELGFIRRDSQKQYHLTPNVLRLGYPAICCSDWHDIAKYYLEQLFKEVRETVGLSILEGAYIMYVIRITEREYMPLDIRIGTRLPVYCTAMGKVMMALGSPKKTRSILHKIAFRPLTQRTITHVDKFLEELNKVRMKGYAINDEELSIGNRAVAAPVVDKHGYAVAAINIAMPTTDYTEKQMEEKLAPQAIKTAREISEALIKMETPLVMEEVFRRKTEKSKS